MENNPREIEFNFNSSENIEELEAARQELSGELAAAAEEQAPAAGDLTAAAEGTVAGSAQTAAEEVEASAPAEEAPVPAQDENIENFLRSRHPINRPAGTPPLRENSAASGISAVELAIAGQSYGAALRIMREQNNISYKELEQATLIQPHYLEALENENLAALPPLVYVIGFIRSLCRFYKLSDASGDAMVAELKGQLEYTCNDGLMNLLDVDRSGEEVNERKLKRIMLALCSAGVLLCAIIVLAIVWSSSAREIKVVIPESTAVEPGKEAKKFDPNTIYPLLEPPTLELPKLPVAE